MTQWISTTQEDYMTKSAALNGDVKIEWSDDITTCTTYIDGVGCLQRVNHYSRHKSYYVNKAVFEEKGE